MDVNTSTAIWSLVNPLTHLSFERIKSAFSAAASWEWWTQGPMYMQQASQTMQLPMTQILTNLFVGTFWAPGLLNVPTNAVRTFAELGKKIIKIDILARSAPANPQDATKRGKLAGLNNTLKTHHDFIWKQIDHHAGLTIWQMKYLNTVWSKTDGNTLKQWLGGDTAINQTSLGKALKEAKLGWVNTPSVRTAILNGLYEVSGSINDPLNKIITLKRQISALRPRITHGGKELPDQETMDTLKQEVTTALSRAAFSLVFVPLSIVNTIFAWHANRFTKTSYAGEILNSTLEGVTKMCSATAAADAAASVGSWASSFAWADLGLKNVLPYYPHMMYGWDAVNRGFMDTATSLHLYAFGIAWNGLVTKDQLETVGSFVQSKGYYEESSAENVGYYALMAPLAAVLATKVAYIGMCKIRSLSAKNQVQGKHADGLLNHAWNSLSGTFGQAFMQHWLPVLMWRQQGMMLNRAHSISSEWYNRGFSCTVFNNLPEPKVQA